MNPDAIEYDRGHEPAYAQHKRRAFWVITARLSGRIIVDDPEDEGVVA